MTETSDGNILFSTRIEANWSTEEEYLVEADVYLIDGDGKRSKLKKLAPIGGAANDGLVIDEDVSGQKDQDEEKVDQLKAFERHGFFKDNESNPINFHADGMSVVMKGGAKYTHRLLTTPGKVLDISFKVQRLDPPTVNS